MTHAWRGTPHCALECATCYASDSAATPNAPLCLCAGGGGGGGGGGGFNFSEWGDNFKRSLTGFFQTVATILLFAAALGALALWRPLLSLLGRLVSWRGWARGDVCWAQQ